MKLSKEELERFDNIKRGNSNLHETWKDLPFLVSLVEKLMKEEPRMRFEQCKCHGWGGFVDGIDTNCKTCKGRGIVHVGTW